MQKTVSVIAWLVAWGWALIAGVGGLVLLIHEGPLPITNGWFAMFSGIAACPLTATLLKRYAHVVVPDYVQLAVALIIFIAGRVAVVLVLHRPFMRYPSMVIAIALAVIMIALMARQDRGSANTVAN
ncbi:MAG TPA: hypothetical protein VGJ82_16490 [Thermoanaerobaculia bacterium]|jgi:hypothetical protein